MGQFDAILVSMERTFENGVHENPGWLIDITS